MTLLTNLLISVVGFASLINEADAKKKHWKVSRSKHHFLKGFGEEEETVGLGLPEVSVDEFSEKTFQNYADHFNKDANKNKMKKNNSYRQRYWENTSHFDEWEGPVVLYLCGH
jgi:hypothetical protein